MPVSAHGILLFPILLYPESSYLGHSLEYSIIYKNEFPVCVLEHAPPYFMLAGLFDLEEADVSHLQMQKLLFQEMFLGVQNGKNYLQHSTACSCIISRDIPSLLLWWRYRESFQMLFFLARSCILMFSFENYRASAPRLLSDRSKTAVPGLQPRGVSKTLTVKINRGALHPSASLTLTL